LSYFIRPYFVRGECSRVALQQCQQQQQQLHRSMQGGSATPYWHSSQGSNLRLNPKENDVDFPNHFNLLIRAPFLAAYLVQGSVLGSTSAATTAEQKDEERLQRISNTIMLDTCIRAVEPLSQHQVTSALGLCPRHPRCCHSL
jgi:nicotinic acid phosphoribosyltransferase